MIILGHVVSGKMMGKIFLSQEGYVKRIKESLGFNPWPGTLNIKLEPKSQLKKRDDLEKIDSIRIKGFETEGKFFGGLRCYPCKVRSLKIKDSWNAGTDGVVIVPDKTRHLPDIIEIISPVNIRESLSLKNKDIVSAELVWK